MLTDWYYLYFKWDKDFPAHKAAAVAAYRDRCQTKRETRVQDHVQRTWENFYPTLNVYDLSQVHGNKSLSLSLSLSLILDLRSYQKLQPKNHCNMLRWPIPFPLTMSPLLPLLSHMKDLLWIKCSFPIKKYIVKANEV